MTEKFYLAFEEATYPCYWLGTDGAFWANKTAHRKVLPICEPADMCRLLEAFVQEQGQETPGPQKELLKTALWVCGLQVLPHPGGMMVVGPGLEPTTIDTFSSGLRGPVSDIFSAVQALSRRLEHSNLRENDELFCNECLESIQKNEYELLRLAYNLEIFSRSLHRRPGREILELSSLVEGLCKKAKNAYVKQGIGFEAEIAPQPLPLKADGRTLGHAVMNLLRNSLMFTREGNEVKVSLQKVGNRAVLTVRDKGQGIRPEAVSHVFAPFYSAYPHLDSAERPGLGLGLALVRGLVRALGGTVAVESVFGEGTAVSLALPLAKQEEFLLKSEAGDYHDFLNDSQSPAYIQLCGFGPLPIL